MIPTWTWLSYVFIHVPQYRQAYTGNNQSQVQIAIDGFQDVIRRFPKCAEGYALYAQVQNKQPLVLLIVHIRCMRGSFQSSMKHAAIWE